MGHTDEIGVFVGTINRKISMMLVLSRKIYESIVMVISCEDGTEQEINVKVLDIGMKKVRLGFETDSKVKILRKELVED